MVCFPAFSQPMAFRGLRMAPGWPARAPRGAQEAYKTAQKRAKSAPSSPQERPKRAPRAILGTLDGQG
eukprot:3730600-Pyramimonas_sp.AAC.1